MPREGSAVAGLGPATMAQRVASPEGATRREGSAFAGLGAVTMKELADNLSSARMRLLELLVFVAGIGAVYATIGGVRATISQDPFVFLRLFTTAHQPLPSFVAFLGFLIPIVAIALGFDSISSEFNRRTMSRILAQPIYRDALLFGKFLAGLTTLAVMLVALWLLLTGLGILLLGLPPSGEEVMRGLVFLFAALAYGGVWLALAMLLSILFRSAATAALACLAIWLLFAFFWQMIVPIVTLWIAPVNPFDPFSQLHAINVGMDISRLSPNRLFAESTLAILDPSTKALGPVLSSDVEGMITGSPLPFGQSMLLIWPQLTGLLAAMVLLFTLAYISFQRQEVRA
ncbi:MAG TPA: ABC transporter permease [Roseiarcus sp.]|nr:ABC transporter permease [Roseiarcus sp.]